jgi:hypothetical protein
MEFNSYFFAVLSCVATKKKVIPTKVVRMPINIGHSDVIPPFGLMVIASESTAFSAGLKYRRQIMIIAMPASVMNILVAFILY